MIKDMNNIINDLSDTNSSIDNLKSRICELEMANSRLEELNKRLVESNKLYSSIIESSPEIIVFALDSNYCYIEFNKKHKETMMSIWGQEIKIGMNFLDIISRQDDREKAKRNFDRALSGDSFTLIEEYGDEKLSRLFWKVFWSPIRTSSDIIYGLTCFCQDVTESIIAKEKLDNEIKFTQAVLESIPGYLYVYDEQGTLIKWNKKHEEMTGYNSEELKQKTLDTWFDKEDYIRVSEAVNDVFSKGYGELEAKLLINNGKSLEILTNGVMFEINEKKYMVGVGVDITNRKKLESELLREKKLLETTLVSVGDGVISCDNYGRVSFLNRVAEFLTGWKYDDAKGRPIEEVFNIINEYTREKSENIVKKVIESRKINELANHTLLISKDGTERPIEDSAAPIIGFDGTIFGVVLVFRDCTAKKEKIEKIEYLSYHDQLTGLYNRRYYEEYLKKIDTEKNLPLSIVMGDINGLKLINDSLGHSVGDELLKKTADVMKQSCKNNHVIARLGGDEFILLLPKTDSLGAEQIINEIKSKASKEKVRTFDISISFGYQTKENIEDDIQGILKNTEDHMYRNKLSESWSMRSRTIEMLMNSLYEKSDREMLHSKRVGEICGLIATKLGLKPDVIKDLSMAGLMHDIGKIGIGESILDKKEKLTHHEWKEIQKHPEIGYRILSSVNEFSEIATYILEHHERWDGKGYPRRLKGEEITLYARIIAIADAYDAMTNQRSYREGLNEEEAIGEIIRCSGTQFDPYIVDVFIEQVVGKTNIFDK
jgi:diguanylate cyclase (GGDEF)-like protein/PAS domain S-box-containing protein